MLEILIDETKLTFFRGITLVKGENGSGKSTFFKNLKNNKYKIKYNEEVLEIKDVNKLISYVSQSHNLPPRLAISELIEMILPTISNDEIIDLAKRLNVLHVIEQNSKFGILSGGEKQKVKFILSWLQNKEIILIDELDNNLDSTSIEVIKEILYESDRIVLLITHNKDYYSDALISNIEVSREGIKQIECVKEKVVSELKLSSTLNHERNFIGLNKYYRFFKVQILIISLVFALIVSTVFVINYIKLDFGFKDPTFSETSTLVTAPIESPLFYTLGNSSWINNYVYFSQEEKESLEKLEYVTTVEPISSLTNVTNNITYIDSNGKYYTLENQELKYDRKSLPQELIENYEKEDIDINDQFSLEFYGLSQPQVVYNKTPYNMGISLYLGSYPEDNSNEVLISLDTANYLLLKENKKDLSDLMDEEYKLNLNEVEGINETGNKDNHLFKVSGIYYEPFEGSSERIIYSYKPELEVAKQNNCSLNNTDSDRLLCMYDVFAKSGYDNTKFREYNDENKLGLYSGFYVEVADEQYLKNLTELLREIDPNIFVDNNYVRTQEFATPVMRNAFSKLILKISSLLLVYASIIWLVNKRHANGIKEVDIMISDYNLEGIALNKYKKKNKNTIFIYCIVGLLIGYMYFTVNALVSGDTVVLSAFAWICILQIIIYRSIIRR